MLLYVFSNYIKAAPLENINLNYHEIQWVEAIIRCRVIVVRSI